MDTGTVVTQRNINTANLESTMKTQRGTSAIRREKSEENKNSNRVRNGNRQNYKLPKLNQIVKLNEEQAKTDYYNSKKYMN